jgi:secreted PhoX family phosphatase
VPDPAAIEVPTRHQIKSSTRFKRGEGIWHDDGTVFVATTSDSRIHAYDIASERFEVLYDGHASPRGPLLQVDQMTATSAGEIFVCEDNGAEQMDIGVMDRSGRVSRFLSIMGAQHSGSEPTGVIFNPQESRMYFASQRAGGSADEEGPGAVYEISGPFRGT